MAVSVEEVRRLDGGSPPAKDVTARLVAKAAAAFGLPNLVLASAGPSRRRGSEDQESILWECESRCSCTPLACISATSGRGTERGGEGKAPKTPAVLDYPATTTAGNDEEDKPDAVENSCCRSLSTGNSLSYTEMKSQAQSQEASIVESSKDSRNLAKHADDLISSVTISSAESGEGMSVKEKPPLKEDNTERQIKTEGKPQAERIGAVSQPEASVTHRRRRAIADFEKEWTFRPRLNLTSLRLASHCGRSSVPVSHRLYQRKTFSVPQLQEEFTFAPKLNAASLRLAQGRADRLPEVNLSGTVSVCTWLRRGDDNICLGLLDTPTDTHIELLLLLTFTRSTAYSYDRFKRGCRSWPPREWQMPVCTVPSTPVSLRGACAWLAGWRLGFRPGSSSCF